jgi:polysaccharide deacetylase 2 family uncharacterized protein YibQ
VDDYARSVVRTADVRTLQKAVSAAFIQNSEASAESAGVGRRDTR